MSTRLAHRAQLYAMNMTIQMLARTRRSSSLSKLFRSFYQVFRREGLVLWSGIYMALCLAGYLCGYIIYHLLPR
jgi:hypothetical protein